MKEPLPDLLWSAPKKIEEHCRVVCAEAGTQVAAAIRSWFRGVDLSFVAGGFHPDTTDERFRELMETSVNAVEGLVKDLPVNPRHQPLRSCSSHPPGLGDDDFLEEGLEEDDPASAC